MGCWISHLGTALPQARVPKLHVGHLPSWLCPCCSCFMTAHLKQWAMPDSHQPAFQNGEWCKKMKKLDTIGSVDVHTRIRHISSFLVPFVTHHKRALKPLLMAILQQSLAQRTGQDTRAWWHRSVPPVENNISLRQRQSPALLLCVWFVGAASADPSPALAAATAHLLQSSPWTSTSALQVLPGSFKQQQVGLWLEKHPTTPCPSFGGTLYVLTSATETTAPLLGDNSMWRAFNDFQMS